MSTSKIVMECRFSIHCAVCYARLRQPEILVSEIRTGLRTLRS
jgi:hypothetical protein